MSVVDFGPRSPTRTADGSRTDCDRIRGGHLGSLLGQWLEDLHELVMDELIAADHVAGLERVVIARDTREDAAGFADDDLPGGDVPGLQVAFPIAIETAGGEESHVQRGCAEPAEASDIGLDFDHLGAREFEIAAPDMG